MPVNVSYNWLREYVPTDLAPKEVAERLTRIGLNVDAIEDLPGGDVRLVVEVTANRPDCLGHVGIARELAAALNAELRLPDAAYAESATPCEKKVRVEIEAPDLCPLYTARLIEGVKVGPSPGWLRQRLEAVGIRPVSNIVDVTNYVMMETGQPLHAFDFARITEGRIVVRRAKAGERFHAIDHSEHALSPERLVIADARRPVALAGVMGGAETEISDATSDILLEAAVFDPLSIRATSRLLALASESSFRFERRVDPGGTDWASRRACALIHQTAGGKIARGVVAAGRPLPEPLELTLRVARIETVLGLAIPADFATEYLRRLGLEVLVATPERIRVRVPSRRGDLEREIDLVEEVARHHGYEKIPESREIPVAYAGPTPAERVRQAAGEVLTAAGYFEAVTFSFTSADRAVRFRRRDVEAEPLALRGAALALRESILPGLLDSLRVNQNADETDARLFEIAKRFVPAAPGQMPHEDAMLALASGSGAPEFENVKGALETLFERLRVADRIRFVPTDRYADLAADQAAEVLLDNEPIGMVGSATKEATAAFELDEPPTVAEVHFGRLIEAAVLEPAYRPLPQYPAIARDLAIVVEEAVRWADVEKAVASAGVAEVESLQALDVYRGKQVPAGKKSVALRLVLRRASGTLTHDDAATMQTRILDALRSALGAELRS
ncbi:MAG: phenylalanine--tRNA ligase subunit beta [Planctomycetota bacterium]|nr:phenylalanine--tRNA ligase subunit beta [Planctomycetota bacterium]